MVRALIWQRGIATQPFPQAAGNAPAPINFPAGSTLRRLHYSLVLQSHQDVPFAEYPPALVIVGVILLDGSPTPPPPDPLADANDDWLWYEGFTSVATQHTVIAPTYTSLQAPPDGAVRDIKAQRKFAFDFPVLSWCYNQAIDPAFTPQYVMQIAYSALIETAP